VFLRDATKNFPSSSRAHLRGSANLRDSYFFNGPMSASSQLSSLFKPVRQTVACRICRACVITGPRCFQFKGKNFLDRSGRALSTTSPLLSGHSKWATIKHDKAKNDSAKNKQRSVLSTIITNASKCRTALIRKYYFARANSI
jgi:hypothetical protein